MSASDSGLPGPDEGVSEPVELAAARSTPGVAVAVVARRLGVAPATLRTWDRRYGLGPSERSAGAHRRYTRDDVLRLMVMRRLTLEGVAPSDAARAALQADLDVERARRATAVSAAQEEARSKQATQRGETPRPRLVHFAKPSLVPEPAEVSPSAVVDAALQHDAQTCAALLALGPDADVVAWWTELVDPAFRRLAERTVLAKPGEAPVQVIASAALRAVREQQEAREAATGSAHPSQMRRIVLVFTAPDEPYPLPAHALGAALAARGVVARIVSGPASPRRAQELVAMVRPVAVALVTALTRPELALISSLHENCPGLPIFVGVSDDAAATELPLSAEVQRVRSFSGLFHEILSVAAKAE